MELPAGLVAHAMRNKRSITAEELQFLYLVESAKRANTIQDPLVIPESLLASIFQKRTTLEPLDLGNLYTQNTTLKTRALMSAKGASWSRDPAIALLSKIPAEPLIGIGVTTFRRPETRERCLANLRQFLPTRYELYVNDDGERTEGIAKSKNRCLTALKHCDYIFLFDDDTWPTTDRWWIPFIERAVGVGCHYFAPTWGAPLNETVCGIQSKAWPCGALQFVTGAAVRICGGLSTFFGRYGGEHEEWAQRIHFSGLTPVRIPDFEGSTDGFCFLDKENAVVSTVSKDTHASRAFIQQVLKRQDTGWKPFEACDVRVIVFKKGMSIKCLQLWLLSRSSSDLLVVIHDNSLTTAQQLRTPSTVYTCSPSLLSFLLEHRYYIQTVTFQNHLVFGPNAEITGFSGFRSPVSLLASGRSRSLIEDCNAELLTGAAFQLPREKVIHFLREQESAAHDDLIAADMNAIPPNSPTFDARPTLMILGCEKYRATLELAIRQFAHPAWRVVGVVGGSSETTFDGSILSVAAPDTYDDLPKKVFHAFEWIARQWPNSIGVFKTDEDILMENVADLATTVLANHRIPYWGLRYDNIKAGTIAKERLDTRFADTTEKTHPAAFYCWGHGYWVSSSAIHCLMRRRKEFYEQYLEDVCVGSCLNSFDIFPEKIPLNYKEMGRAELIAMFSQPTTTDAH